MSKNTIFTKERSIKACMADAWKIIALNWKTYLSALWIYALLASVANALFVEINLQYICEQALPALLLQQSGGDAEMVKIIATPTLSNLVLSVVSFVFYVFGNLCFLSRVFKTIKHYKAHNEMPVHLSLTLNAADWQCMKRVFNALLVSVFAFLLISAPFVYVSVKWLKWLWIVVPIIMFYFASFSVLCTLRHALYDNALAPSIRYALQHAFGLSFILMLLTAILTTIAMLVVSLPQTLYVCSEIAATKSQLMNDSVSLPWGLPLLFFIINTICFAFSTFLSTYFTWTLSLKVQK